MVRILRKWTALFLAALLMFLCGLPRAAFSVSAQWELGDTIEIQIGDVQITKDQLLSNHCKVSVPVTLAEGATFSTLSFGMKWDTDAYTVQGVDYNSALSDYCTHMFSGDGSMIWFTCISLNDHSDETDVCTLTAVLNTNVQAGDQFALEGAYKNLGGYEAQYTDKEGNAYPVEIHSGTITVVDEIAPEVALQIGSVEPTTDDLYENGYVVEVPITATANNGFGEMWFGFTWDTTELIADSPSGNTPNGLAIEPIIDNAAGVGWIHVIATSTYTGSDICTLRFFVPEDSKPADIYAIKGCTESTQQQAYVASRNGTAGTLTMEDGRIFVRSPQKSNAYAFGNIMLPTLSVSQEDLENSNYLISVPITISKNSYFLMLSFGVQWSTNDLSFIGCTVDENSKCNMTQSPSENNDAVWLGFLCGSPYTGTTLCTLTFRVRSDMSLGEIPLKLLSSDEEGHTAFIRGEDGEDGTMNLKNGTIKLVDPNELSAVATVKIGDVEVSPNDLWLNSNRVEVPITLNKNSGISALCFGIRWDSNVTGLYDVQSADVSRVGINHDYGSMSDAAWLRFNCVAASTGYVYYDSALGILKLDLQEDLPAGTVITIEALNTNDSGDTASVEAADGSVSSPVVLSGSIRIVDDAATETTAPETTTVLSETTTIASEETTVTQEETTTTTEKTTTFTATTETTTTTTTTTETTTTTVTSATTATTVTTTATTPQAATATTEVSGAHLAQTALQLTIDAEVTLQFLPDSDTSGNCIWRCADSSIVSLSPGDTDMEITLSAIAVGTTEVSVLYQGVIYRCEVTVKTDGADDLTGDINCDDKLDLTDLVTLNRILLEQIACTDTMRSYADLNGDGVLNCLDVLLLQQKLLRLEKTI